jgi:catechol 2,3-dioxygenase-like lactoylglutathione lyase family enzyme
MIIGGHIMIQSRDDAADKAFFRDVLGLDHVDAGDGFLIFALPPSEFAVHRSSDGDGQQFFLMIEDMDAFASALRGAGIAFTPPADRGWGTLTQITLPGGGALGAYQPHHPSPHKSAAKRSRPKKSSAKKKSARKGLEKEAGARNRQRSH